MKNISGTPPVKTEFAFFTVRLGKIFSNLSIFFLILCLCGVLSFVTTAFILLCGLTAILITLGTIFIIIPDYWDKLMVASNISAEVSEFFFQNIFWFVGFSVAFALLALLLLVWDKKRSHVPRIVLSSVILAVALLCIVVVALGGNKA